MGRDHKLKFTDSKVYPGLFKNKIDSWNALNEQLVKEKFATPALVEDSHGHSYVINILALFWHQEFMMYFPELNDEQKIKKALAIFFSIL